MITITTLDRVCACRSKGQWYAKESNTLTKEENALLPRNNAQWSRLLGPGSRAVSLSLGFHCSLEDQTPELLLLSCSWNSGGLTSCRSNGRGLTQWYLPYRIYPILFWGRKDTSIQLWLSSVQSPRNKLQSAAKQCSLQRTRQLTLDQFPSKSASRRWPVQGSWAILHLLWEGMCWTRGHSCEDQAWSILVNSGKHNLKDFVFSFLGFLIE